MKVAVCVCTYRRPESLERLLASLADQRFTGEPPAVELVVVDNDAEGSARETVDRWTDRIGWPVRYAIERERGIPHARNRALAEAPEDAEVVAMLDDDDRPEAEWLGRLVDGLERYDADVVTGPQMPIYGDEIPGWVVGGRFFEGRRRPAGAPVHNAYTHNVAFRVDVLEALGDGFDESLAGQGGEDADLFRRVELAGHRMVWVDDAVVLNPVPPERATPAWILRRYFGFGVTSGRLQRRHEEPLLRRVGRVGKMLGSALLSPVRLATRLPSGRAALVGLAVDWLLPIGYGLGWLGFTYEEYHRREYAEAQRPSAPD